MKYMDYIYLEEDYYKTKEESFSFIINLLELNKKMTTHYWTWGVQGGSFSIT